MRSIPDLMVHADSAEVMGLISGEAAAVYRTSWNRHRSMGPGERRQILCVDAMRWGARELAERLAAVPVDGCPEPVWRCEAATGSGVEARLVFERDADSAVRAAATIRRDGRTVLLTGAYGGVRMWGTDGAEVPGRVLDGRAGQVNAVAFGELGGDMVAVTIDYAGDTGADEDADGDDDEDGWPEAMVADDEDEDGQVVRVWSISTGTQVRAPFAGPDGYVADASLLDGDVPYLLTVDADGPVRVWNLDEDEPVGTELSVGLDEDERAAVAVAGAVVGGVPIAVVVDGDRRVRIWHPGEHGGPVGELPHDPDDWAGKVVLGEVEGRTVVVTAGTSVRVWDLATREPIGERMTGHDDYVHSIAMGVHEGRPVIVTGGMDCTTRIWDAGRREQAGDPLAGHSSPVGMVAVGGADGRTLVVSGDNRTLRLWDLSAEARAGRPVRGHIGWITGIAAGELDDRPIAVSSGRDSTVRAWDLDGLQSVETPATGSTAGCVAFGEVDGRTVVAAGNFMGRPTISDLRTPPDSGPAEDEATADEPAEDADATYALACIQVAGRSLAVSGGLGKLVLWDLASREPVGELPTEDLAMTHAVACTRLGGRPVAVSCGQEDVVRAWDLTTMRELWAPLSGHHTWIRSIACGRLDGRPIVLTGGDDATVRAWDLATGAPIGRPMTGHADSVNAVAHLESKGGPVAVGGGRDGTVRAWDLTTGRPAGPEFVLPAAVSALTPTPDGRLLAAFGWDLALLTPTR